MSKLTASPPRRLSKFSEVSTPLWWKKYSLPSSAAMNPNPRSDTIFFTVPFGIARSPPLEHRIERIGPVRERRMPAAREITRRPGERLYFSTWRTVGWGSESGPLRVRDPLAVFSRPAGLRRHGLDRHPERVSLPDPAPAGPADPCPRRHARLDHPGRIRHLPLALRRGLARGRQRPGDSGTEPAGGGRDPSLRPCLPERQSARPSHLRFPGVD